MVLRWLPYIPPQYAIFLDSAVTALAVAASLYLVEPDLRKGIAVIFAAFILSAIVSYATQYQSTIRLQETTKETIVEMLLEQLVSKYEKDVADCPLRANVMEVDRRWASFIPPSRERFMKIEYNFGDYSAAELEQEYTESNGCAGRALNRSNPTYYDSEQKNEPDYSLSATQRQVTEEVCSILSTPIYPDNNTSKQPIGVLSLDSTENINTTNLDTEEARMLAMKYAGVLGHVLS